MRKLILSLVFLATSSFAADKAIDFKKRKLKINKVIAEVEVAESEEQHQHGLMYRQKLGANEGMLFIFPNEEPRSFWMKNTLVNLSIGFFDKKKKLIDIQEMQAVKTLVEQPQSYLSSGPAQYALEMPRNWFKKKNIKKGAIFELLPEQK